MKKLILSFSMLLGFATLAQDMPKLSPFSKSEVTVGVTKISLQYSRPSVREREVFGDVVPYGEVWRLGANEATKITTSNELHFGDQKLAAGTYAIFVTPVKEGDWKVVFNSDTEQWGTGSYKEENDVVAVMVSPTRTDFTETLLIDINNITPQSASIIIKWHRIMLSIPFKVDTDAHVKKNIDDAIAAGKDLDKVYYSAANYYFAIKSDNETALTYIDKAIAIKKTHTNLFLKARILHKKGEIKEAIKLAEEAKKMAEEAKEERWVNYIGETLDEWKK